MELVELVELVEQEELVERRVQLVGLVGRVELVERRAQLAGLVELVGRQERLQGHREHIGSLQTSRCRRLGRESFAAALAAAALALARRACPAGDASRAARLYRPLGSATAG